MTSKRNKRKRSATIKQSAQLYMQVIDNGGIISSTNASNHFGYSTFELTIQVQPSVTNFEPQPINIQLVFEDGQQIDSENKKNLIKFQTYPNSLTLNKHGQCIFQIQIDTYSMFHDNRAFKLVVSLNENATRHIIACETNPFKLVKHRLEIVSEPESTFYKDEGGRANCLQCQILLRDCNGNTVKNRDIPLQITLVYSDMSIAQSYSDTDILDLITQDLSLKHGQCYIDFRITEVSKNHNKRAFKLVFECKSNDPLYHDISSCVTEDVLVKSKRTKKRSNTDSNHKRKRNMCDSNDNKPEFTIPKLKKQRHNTNSHSKGNGNHHSLSTLNTDNYYVPPPMTGLLPSICPGTLPRIGHNPPLFANLSKAKIDPSLQLNRQSNLFEWCRMAEWILHRLEWTHSGYEYDENTHAIDTRRPLYRCSDCLRYRNESGYGKHESWCQLKSALRSYEREIKSLLNEWNRQINGSGEGQMGQMTSLDKTNNSPPHMAYISHISEMGSLALKNERNGNSNNAVCLPIVMDKISSVSRVRSEHGYDAYDKNNAFIGVFDESGVFSEAGQLNEYQPIFDDSQMMIRRNESDDHLFYNNLRSSIFDGGNEPH